MSGDGLDPIVLALVQNRLDNISLQMGWVMTRTARSPIFNHAHDFSCYLTDRTGTIVAQADGIPIHTGGGGFAARALIDAFGDTIAPATRSSAAPSAASAVASQVNHPPSSRSTTPPPAIDPST